MSELIWRHAAYENPRIHGLYRGRQEVGMVSRVSDNAYGVYQRAHPYSPGANEFVCVVPTLDEAKGLLETIAGSQQ